jgi:hypothetical protein
VNVLIFGFKEVDPALSASTFLAHSMSFKGISQFCCDNSSS